MTTLKLGIYRHYKPAGALYQVLGLAHDANVGDRTCVVYFPLELNKEHLGPRLAVRTLENFLGRVHEDGSGCAWEFRRTSCYCAGVSQHRFTYLGPELTEYMLYPASPAAAQPSGWTRHGHMIAGVLQVESKRPKFRARCGGPGLCNECAREAAAQLKLADSASASVPGAPS